ncbi:MAG: WD40/YVTN/BNR-like repeat-containing protein [Nitrospiraceae bacterium]
MPIQGNSSGYNRPEGGWRYIFKGLKTNESADEIPETKYPYVANVRDVSESLQTRPGYSQLFTTIPTGCHELNWTISTSSIVTGWENLSYSPELDRLISMWFLGLTPKWITSDDQGDTWDAHTGIAFGPIYLAVCWAAALSLFVAVGVSDAIATSPDGDTFTPQTPPGDSLSWNAICYSPDLNLLVAVSADGVDNSVMTSGDGGTTWVSRSMPTGTTTHYWKSVIWIAAFNLFVAVGGSDSGDEQAATSPDGVTWTLQAPPNPSGLNNWASVIYSPELHLLVAVGQAGTLSESGTMSSADGVTWILGTSIISADDPVVYLGVCWSTAMNLFVAVGLDDGSGNSLLTHSSDGLTFTIDTSPTASGMYAVVSIPGVERVVAVGDNEEDEGQLVGVCAD